MQRPTGRQLCTVRRTPPLRNVVLANPRSQRYAPEGMVSSEEEQTAERLARTILSDIVLHNDDKVQQARQEGDVLGVLIEEIEDGRVLFRQRVSAELYPVYEQAVRRLAASDLSEGDGSAADSAPPMSAAAAERLARAILADTQIYYEPKFRGACSSDEVMQSLGDEIDEGRSLFQQRVRSTLHEVFERQLKEWTVAVAQRQTELEATGRPSPTPPMGYTSYHPPPGDRAASIQPSSQLESAAGGVDLKWLLWLLATAAVVAVAVWLLLGR